MDLWMVCLDCEVWWPTELDISFVVLLGQLSRFLLYSDVRFRMWGGRRIMSALVCGIEWLVFEIDFIHRPNLFQFQFVMNMYKNICISSVLYSETE